MDPGEELKGQVALVTGGARGIGRAVATSLAGAGAAVVIADLVPAAALEPGLTAKVLDVSDFEATQRAVREIAEEMGGLHILVNNAGIAADQILPRMKVTDWQRVLEVNLGGCFHCCRAAARIMVKARQGRIINISSLVARTGRIGQGNYAASKAGIEGLTRSLALELAHRSVTVNAVAPGYIETEMTRVLPEKIRREVLGQIPLGRTGAPGDVAAVVRFLAGPGAAYITGQTIAVNGGLYFG